jgi:hypothetical protein
MIYRLVFAQTGSGGDVFQVDSLIVPVKKVKEQFLAFILQQSPYL